MSGQYGIMTPQTESSSPVQPAPVKVGGMLAAIFGKKDVEEKQQQPSLKGQSTFKITSLNTIDDLSYRKDKE